MSSLSVYHESSCDLPNKVLTHLEDIASTLAALGVQFERWQAASAINAGASEEHLLAAYQPQIDRLRATGRYHGVELISVRDDQAEWRAGGIGEHRQADDEAYFCVVGRGLFNLHIDDYVYAVLCEKGDLLTIPAGTRRWFDLGEHPHWLAIRLFGTHPDGAREITGDDIASRCSRLDD